MQSLLPAHNITLRSVFTTPNMKSTREERRSVKNAVPAPCYLTKQPLDRGFLRPRKSRKTGDGKQKIVDLGKVLYCANSLNISLITPSRCSFHPYFTHKKAHRSGQIEAGVNL